MKASDFKEVQDVRFDNVEVMWAKLQSPDTRFEPAWKIDVVLSDGEAKKYRDAGFHVRTNDDGKHLLQLKRKVTKRNGEKMDPPLVVGRDGTTIFNELVGNGSVCNVVGRAREYSTGKVTVYLNAVQIVKHVEAPASTGMAFSNLD